MPRVATASSSQIAADAAAQVADDGGNAVDCAIAAALVTMNTEPGVCALAGGAYVTLWPAGADPVTIDGNVAVPGRGCTREPAPPDAVDMEYGGGVHTIVGSTSVAVPGSVAALHLASQRYGRLPWARVLAPAIACARDGFPLPRACHYYLQYSGTPIFGRSTDGYAALHDERGTLYDAGSTIHVPHLAGALQELADEGPAAFYRGELARAMVAHVQAGGGRLSLEDLAGYRAEERQPLMCGLGRWRIACNPPPAVGGTVLAAMLGAYAGRAPAAIGVAESSRLVEVQHAVLRFRRDRLDLSDDIAADAAGLLAAVASDAFPGDWVSAATVHTSAVDDGGNACAITASAGYGSGEMPAGTGLWLNNCLGELELNRRGLDAGPPGRRLPSNMAPGVARERERVLAFGSPGADRITTAILQFLLNFILRSQSLEQAIAAPRLHVELHPDGDRVAAEHGLELAALPLPVNVYPDINMYFGGVVAALYECDTGFQVAADPRREGGTVVAGQRAAE